MLRGIIPPAYYGAPTANWLLAQLTYESRLSLEEVRARVTRRLDWLEAAQEARAVGRGPPPQPYDEFDGPAYQVPLVLDGWVLAGLTNYTETRTGGTMLLYWLDTQGQLGVSYQGGNNYSPKHRSPTGLRASIKPAPTDWELPPEIAAANAEADWPRERLLALARGEIHVDNPALQWYNP
ncbi:hypothetical protein [Meiothermus granaticius]|uniref:Uncharacterized protein n=1 Tax=Meiothermus granaticius NBRC 107808 TaxID=1227551 RepID=A0A399F6C4_9DEIN|nr:hypothetical protein [Meiothermus granaticius]RIH91176.1 hypothetical protein Mgrana_02960 [Meiothermus granaticius NBRC 107808]GEM88377.1 hypothetical protein MGR01S_30020 [Meiothermus granaticius NBRC 107808]